MVYTLDKYQEVGFGKMLDPGLYVLQGRSSSGKSYLIRNILNKRWAQGKSTLVVTNSVEDAKLIQRQLREFQLGRYSLVIDDVNGNTSEVFDRIEKLNQEEKISVSKKEIDVNNLLFNHHNEKLKNYYNKLNKKILFDNSLNKIAIINGFEASSYSNIHFNQLFSTQIFEFSEEEYTHLLKNVKIAYQFFTNGNNKTDKYFKEDVYSKNSPEEVWEDILEWLVKSKESVIKVIEQISSFLQEQSSKNFVINWSKIRESQSIIDKSLLDIDKIRIQYKDVEVKKSTFFNFSKAAKENNDKFELEKKQVILDYKQVIRALNKIESIKNNYPLPNEDLEELEKIYTNFQSIKSELKNYKNTINEAILKELKSMNFRNVENEVLTKIQIKLDNLFKYLNDGYAKKVWEDNAFSINKQLNYLENILDDLNNLESQKLAFFNNFKWNNFLLSIDEKSKYFIEKLNIYKPDDWQVFLRNWFVQNLILNNKIQLNENIDDSLQLLVEANDTINRSEVNKSIRIWQNKREIFWNQDKRIREYYSNYKSEGEDIKWGTIIKYDELMSEYFPVVLMPRETYKKYKDKLNFELVIFENLQYYVPVLPELLPKNAETNLIFSIVESEDVQSINKALVVNNYNKPTTEIELKGYHQQGMMSLLDMNYNERLYAARNIAHLLESANKNIKIFHYNTLIIFSTLDDILNKVLYKLLNKYGLKEKKIIDTPFHLIVDNILEVNTKQILITQNNLLNYSSIDNILWQLYAINKIKKSGIKVVNFNTSVLFDDAIGSIKEFVKENFS